jgi:hypothetical protein
MLHAVNSDRLFLPFHVQDPLDTQHRRPHQAKEHIKPLRQHLCWNRILDREAKRAVLIVVPIHVVLESRFWRGACRDFPLAQSVAN